MSAYEELKELLTESEWRQFMSTADGVEITPDLMVWTYDWRWEKVGRADFEHRLEMLVYNMKNLKGFEASSNDFWFNTNYRALYNGERMVTICPNCRQKFEQCHTSGCGGRKEANWTPFKEDGNV